MSMYLEHFGLREAPFRITPHTGFFYDGAQRGATLEALLYAVTHDEGIVKVTGEVGSGKTMLCRMLLERLPEHVESIYLANPSLNREELLYALADELKIPSTPQRTHLLLREIQQHLVTLYSQGRRVLVLIDEAHAMPAESLEEIRLLSNLESRQHKLLQIVLFGQPELNGVLSAQDMRQLRERITHNFALEPLQHTDIGTYLMFRLRAAGYRGPDLFSPAALQLFAQTSEGLTRRLNLLADKALLAAFANNTHLIDTREAQAAIADAKFEPIAPRANNSRKRATPAVWQIALGSIAGATVVGTLWFVVGATPQNIVKATHPTPPPPPLQSPVQSPPQPALVPPMSSGELLENFRPWIAQVDARHFVIQLARIPSDQRQQIDALLAGELASLDRHQIRVYEAPAGGQRWIGVIYGDYPGAPEADAALRALPRTIGKYTPFVRPVQQIKRQFP